MFAKWGKFDWAMWQNVCSATYCLWYHCHIMKPQGPYQYNGNNNNKFCLFWLLKGLDRIMCVKAWTRFCIFKLHLLWVNIHCYYVFFKIGVLLCFLFTFTVQFILSIVGAESILVSNTMLDQQSVKCFLGAQPSTSPWEYNAAWNWALAKSDAQLAVEANLLFQKGLGMLCVLSDSPGSKPRKVGGALVERKGWVKAQSSLNQQTEWTVSVASEFYLLA